MQEKNDFDSIHFKPLSEGLGLNHFSDGLPYTPSARKRREIVQFNYPPPRPPAQEAVAMPAPESVAVEVRVEPATMFRRLCAFTLDVGFSALVFTLVVWGSFKLNGFSVFEILRVTNGQAFLLPLMLLFAVLFSGYFLIQEMTWRRTLGKAILGVRISATSGFAILGRFFLFILAFLPAGLGIFWSIFDGRRRGLHDILSGSEVVR